LAETGPESGAKGPLIPLRRLKKRAEFLFVRGGAKAVRAGVIIEARRRQETESADAGAGFTASRKAGAAVTRNRARRRLREAARKFLPELGLSGVDYVFVARPATADLDWARLLDDVQNALLRLRAELGADREASPRRAARPTRPSKAVKPGPNSTESD
jgi:ribonuclease P protein component